MNLTQILRGQSSTITLNVYADGDLSDEGTPTLELRDLDGDAVATPVVVDNSDGTYEATIPAQSDLALLEQIFTFGSDLEFDQGRIEIVGGLLFTEASARAFDSARLADTSKYSDAGIAVERLRITDWLESQTGVSWVPRYRRAILRGNGTNRISLLDTVRSYGPSGGEGSRRDINTILAATINDTAVDVDDLEIDGHAIWHTAGHFTIPTYGPNIEVDYEYGRTHIQDGVDRVALLELVDRLPSSRLSRAATSSSDELGSYGWDPQNNGRPSRIPEVNAWCRNNDLRSLIA